jgi:hypothetical protein
MWNISAIFVRHGEARPYRGSFTGDRQNALSRCFAEAARLGGYLLEVVVTSVGTTKGEGNKLA